MHFETAFKYVVLNEGRFDNDPTDRGGETHWGITVGAAQVHRCDDHPRGINIKDVDLKVAKHIYLFDYWKFSQVNDIAVAVKLFDYAVNFGPSISVRYAQEAANSMGEELIVDGIFGKMSSSAINNLDPLRFIDFLEQVASMKYVRIVQNDFIQKYGKRAFEQMQLKYLAGWITRSNKRYYNDVPLSALGDEA